MVWNSERSPCSVFGGKNSNENEWPPCASSSLIVRVRSFRIDGWPRDIRSRYRYRRRQPRGKHRRGRAGVGRFGDGPHHDDAASTGSEHLVEVVEIDAADGEPRPRRRQARSRIAPVPALEPDGPAWSASASTARRRSSRRLLRPRPPPPRFRHATSARSPRRPTRSRGRLTPAGRLGRDARSVRRPPMRRRRDRSPRAVRRVARMPRRTTSSAASSCRASMPFWRSCTMSTPLAEHGVEKLLKITLAFARVDAQVETGSADRLPGVRTIDVRAPALGHDASPPCRGSRPAPAPENRAIRHR